MVQTKYVTFSKQTPAVQSILLVDSWVVIQGQTDQGCSVQIAVQAFSTESVLLVLSTGCAYTSTSYSFPPQLFHVLICFLRASSDIHASDRSCAEDVVAHGVLLLSQQDFPCNSTWKCCAHTFS